MENSPEIPSPIGQLACSCKRKCTITQCDCLENGLKCTQMCRLSNCENWQEDDSNEGSIEELCELSEDEEEEEEI